MFIKFKLNNISGDICHIYRMYRNTVISLNVGAIKNENYLITNGKRQFHTVCTVNWISPKGRPIRVNTQTHTHTHTTWCCCCCCCSGPAWAVIKLWCNYQFFSVSVCSGSGHICNIQHLIACQLSLLLLLLNVVVIVIVVVIIIVAWSFNFPNSVRLSQ